MGISEGSINGAQGSNRFQPGSLSDGSVFVMDKGTGDRYKFQQSLMSVTVTNDVFPHKKFIQKEEEMEFGKKLQHAVVKGVGINKDNEKEFWSSVREQVRRTLTKKRNNVMEHIKKKMSCE